jgi:hypothetical protein
MKALIFTLLIFLNSSQAFSFGRDLSIADSRFTSIYKGIIDELKFQDFTFEEKKILFNAIRGFNENTLTLPQDLLNHFTLTELYKVILDSDHTDTEKIKTITKDDIKSAQYKLKKLDNKLSIFAKYIINEVLKDFLPFIDNGKLNQFYKGLLRSKKEIRQIKNLLKYSSGWIKTFNLYSEKDFNKVSKEVFIQYVTNLNIKSKLFKKHSFPQQKKYKAIFQFKNLQTHINTYELAVQPTTNEAPSTVDPQAAIKDLQVEKHDAASGKIDELIESIPSEE